MYSLNLSCVENLKLIALTVAEISRGPKFLDAPLAQTPANFGRKSSFLVTGELLPDPSCVPNLKFLASMVA